MKLKNTLLLLLLAMGAFAYIWFVERHQKSTKELAEDGNLVAKFDRDKVDAISIKSTEGKIELKRDGKDAWQLVEPIKDRADSMAISQLFTDSEALRYAERIDENGKGVSKDKLKEFGLCALGGVFMPLKTREQASSECPYRRTQHSDHRCYEDLKRQIGRAHV